MAVSAHPVQSMTGYAVLDFDLGDARFRAHLKSVNHRHFELKWRAPRAWMPFEVDAKQSFQTKLGRGTVECWVESATKSEGAPAGNAEGAQALLTRLQEAATSARGLSPLTLPPFVRALVLARFPETWWERESESSVPKDGAKLALDRLADELLEVRRREGAKLAELILTAAECMAQTLGRVENLRPALLETSRKDFQARLASLSEEFKVAPAPEQRLLQEFLLLSEKRDVAEEIGRIRIHLGALKGLFRNPPAQCGKRVEFLAQELHREWTTLGTKIHDPAVTTLVIDAKLELDRIREQAANLV